MKRLTHLYQINSLIYFNRNKLKIKHNIRKVRAYFLIIRGQTNFGAVPWSCTVCCYSWYCSFINSCELTRYCLLVQLLLLLYNLLCSTLRRTRYCLLVQLVLLLLSWIFGILATYTYSHILGIIFLILRQVYSILNITLQTLTHHMSQLYTFFINMQPAGFELRLSNASITCHHYYFVLVKHFVSPTCKLARGDQRLACPGRLRF